MLRQTCNAAISKQLNESVLGNYVGMRQIGHVTNDTSVVGGVFATKNSRVEPSAVRGASNERLGSSNKVEVLNGSSNEVEVSNDDETANHATNNSANTLIHLSSEDNVSENQSSIEESMENNVEKENVKESEKENEKELEKEVEKCVKRRKQNYV